MVCFHFDFGVESFRRSYAEHEGLSVPFALPSVVAIQQRSILIKT